MLVELLQSETQEARDYALWSLSLSTSADNQDTIADAGGVDPLIQTLGDPRGSTREQAAAALAKLAHNNEGTRDAIAKAGGVAALRSSRLLSPPGRRGRSAAVGRAMAGRRRRRQAAAAMTVRQQRSEGLPLQTEGTRSNAAAASRRARRRQ